MSAAKMWQHHVNLVVLLWHSYNETKKHFTLAANKNTRTYAHMYIYMLA